MEVLVLEILEEIDVKKETKKDLVFIDYLTFTVRYLEDKNSYKIGVLPNLFRIIGIRNDDFDQLDTGKNHYDITHVFSEGYVKISTGEVSLDEEKEKYLNKKQIKKSEALNQVLLESSITFTGTGCREFVNLSAFKETLFEMLLRIRKDERLLIGKKHKNRIVFTRLDFTKDDYDGVISPRYVLEKTNKREFVSRLDVDHYIESQKDESGKFAGMTVYLGSPKKSEFFIRFYDKTSERKAKNKKVDNENISRIEMVFKKKQADAAMYKIFDCYDNEKEIGKVYSETLMSKIYFLEDNFSRVSDSKTNKRHIDKRWLDFTETAKGVPLGVSKEPSTIENKQKYRDTSIARPLANLAVAEGVAEFLTITNELIRDSIEELRLEDEIQIKKYWKEKEPSLTEEALEVRLRKEKEKSLSFLEKINRFYRTYLEKQNK